MGLLDRVKHFFKSEVSNPDLQAPSGSTNVKSNESAGFSAPGQEKQPHAKSSRAKKEVKHTSSNGHRASSEQRPKEEPKEEPKEAPQKAPAGSGSRQDFFSDVGEANRYAIKEVIGKGSYGVVCSAVDNFTGEMVAIKKITDVFQHVSDATRILREIKLLRLLKHPDIVDIKHIMLPPSARDYKDIYVVFELMETDLHQVIKANDDLTPDHHQYFLYQMLRGLKYIHSSEAPELCGSFFAKYSPSIDIWSVGCMFAEIIMGKPLFPGRNVVHQLELITDLLGTPSQEVIAKVRNEKARRFLLAMRKKPGVDFEQHLKHSEPEALALLKRLLAFDPADRPTAEQALEDPYFIGLHNPAREPVGKPISRFQFEFDRQKLAVEEVRELIYVEICEYHPKALIDHMSGNKLAFNNPSALDNFKRQFMHLEANPGETQGGPSHVSKPLTVHSDPSGEPGPPLAAGTGLQLTPRALHRHNAVTAPNNLASRYLTSQISAPAPRTNMAMDQVWATVQAQATMASEDKRILPIPPLIPEERASELGSTPRTSHAGIETDAELLKAVAAKDGEGTKGGPNGASVNGASTLASAVESALATMDGEGTKGGRNGGPSGARGEGAAATHDETASANGPSSFASAAESAQAAVDGRRLSEQLDALVKVEGPTAGGGAKNAPTASTFASAAESALAAMGERGPAEQLDALLEAEATIAGVGVKKPPTASPQMPDHLARSESAA
eukprot:gene23027-30219_t